MMTTRPTLRSSWEIVCPRFSRSVVTESSPSSTATLDPLRREPDDPSASQASNQMPRTRNRPGACASPSSLRISIEAIDDVGERERRVTPDTVIRAGIARP